MYGDDIGFTVITLLDGFVVAGALVIFCERLGVQGPQGRRRTPHPHEGTCRDSHILSPAARPVGLRPRSAPRSA